MSIKTVSEVKQIRIRDNASEFTPYSFADCFVIKTDKSLSAEQAAKIAIEKGPKWVKPLMMLRNLIVSPLGLKTNAPINQSQQAIGMFPIIYKSENKLVMGFDDKHLDFKIVVEVESNNSTNFIYSSTYVQTHNLLGKAYLFAVKPFHKIIVASSLRLLDK